MTRQPNLDMLGRVSHAVINRLNYPKREAKAMTPAQLRGKVYFDHKGQSHRHYPHLRPLLSFHDCEDVQQTVALQLHTTGALYRDNRHKLKLSDWIACFRACRATLRIDRKAREDATDIAKLHDVAQLVIEPERNTARRIAIARRIRYLLACIATAYNADKSRKRAFNRKRALRFLRMVASQASACGLGSALVSLGNDTSALRHASMDFRRYCDTGEKLLEKQSSLDLATREAQLATVHGQAKTFRALTYKAKRALIAA